MYAQHKNLEIKSVTHVGYQQTIVLIKFHEEHSKAATFSSFQSDKHFFHVPIFFPKEEEIRGHRSVLSNPVS